MISYHNRKMFQKFDVPSSLCRVFLPQWQEQEVIHPFIHSNHAWQALVQAWHFRGEKQSGHQNVTSSMEKAETQTQSQYTEICCDRGSTGHWGAPRRTPCQTREVREETAWWTKAWAESWKWNRNCLGNCLGKNMPWEETALEKDRRMWESVVQ